MTTIRFQQTPNPNAGKFVVGRPVVDGKASKSFYSAAQAASEPVAAALFGVTGVQSLFMADDFITVMKEPAADWQQLVPVLCEAIDKSIE